ncbi:uncharacterized protein LOC114929732 [Nylanderia fulva]|uniref:uncharacterized protein LOC114929732 n=1 Tax=Nylanderia fulva TaxID=613905 RepID=UPI0010FB2327|nr:uncharacterized protein LOC114929732 [Nylanderia fulva]
MAQVAAALQETSPLQSSLGISRELTIRLERVDSQTSITSSEGSFIAKRTRGRAGASSLSGADRSRSPSRSRWAGKIGSLSEYSSFDPELELDQSSVNTERAELPSFREINRRIDREIKKRGGIPQPHHLEEPQEDGDQAEESIIPTLKEKRGRGRPVTTGQYEILKEKKSKEEEERKIQKEKGILDPLIKPAQTKSYKEFLERIKEKEEEYRYAPVLDLEAMISEKSTDIYKMAVQSGNVKGTLVKLAKDAAADMCAAAMILALKAQNPPEMQVVEQINELKHQMHLLRMENAQLRRMVEQTKQQKRKPLDTEAHQKPLWEKQDLSLFQERGKRTEEWVRENSPPPEDGGISAIGIDPITETPLPSTRENGEQRNKGGKPQLRESAPPQPQQHQQQQQQQWSTVVSRRTAQKAKGTKQPPVSKAGAPSPATAQNGKQRPGPPKKRREPNTAAITRELP